ncbi:protein phosphatase 1-binding protein bifocal [Temnothorax americanus]|uniref:protein phosphatase 1-binding protein bifocal n=1 Tax=Temnothorax americanus TaxID=1964332 RepID=UPI0040694213
MATTGSNATANAGNEASGGNNVPQWKRDLIQRRRQQSKVLANNGASVKLCSAMIGTSSVTSASGTALDGDGDGDGGVAERSAATVQERHAIAGALRATRLTTGSGEDTTSTVAVRGVGGGGGGGSGSALLSSPASYPARRPPTGGATVAAAAGGTATAADFTSPVAYNMRLEADLSLCSDAEDVVNGTTAKFADVSSERKLSEYIGEESEEAASRTADGKPLRTTARMNENDENNASSRRDEIRAVLTGRREKETFHGEILRTLKDSSRVAPPSRASSEDAESDSSEELRYGPGIVNKLKCKYLNLALRETNESRASVQRFRRAASLEDLLDRDDDEASSREKIATGRKYAKRSGSGSGGGAGGIVAVPKTDRYRNASRGNDSMKRARSVETLTRYNSVTADEATNARQVPVARPVTNGVRREPVNDHVILVDRTSVKIESRLSELDRPKPINKPKRIKPVLAETERPPPDLVKTTMRIFESSARKLKPKGEVAAKVATFKTINDAFKAQTRKKLVQKPPLQPKPFVNGGAAGGVGSPKKIVLPHKPTAELIETRDGKEEYRIDGVIAEPIVQSVSSVVSKFQQIEKSRSPSPSPEPSSYELKFSPANSPEPPRTCKSRSAALEIAAVKSPPVTPVLSPRILSPRLRSPPSPVRQGARSPSSPVKDLIRVRIPSPLREPPLPSPVKGESSKTEPESKILRPQIEKETPKTNVESPRHRARVPESSSADVEWKEDAKSSRVAFDGEKNVDEEIVDGPRTISKTALDNIGQAGTTMQFNFGDESTSDKSYLPGAKRNGRNSADEPMPEEDGCIKTECRSKVGTPASVVTSEASSRLREKLEPEEESDGKDIEEKLIVPENKPIGAICSLGLIKTVTTTTITTTMSSPTTYSRSNNEAKTMRCQQKSEFSPPQKQIGVIRPLVSTKTLQHPQQNLSNRELEKNLINRVMSIEQPTKVVVSLKSADEIQPAKKTNAGSGGGGGGLWDTKPWNQQNNTMVFNFSNRKDVPDYIENDGLIIRRKREKPKVGDGSIIVLDATLDASTTDDAEWEISGGPPSPCDVSFLNDNVLINGRSNLSRTPRHHKHRIQFDDTATRTFEYPSEASILEGETSSVDGETSSSTLEKQSTPCNNKISSTTSSMTNMPSLLGGSGLASYTPSKVDLTSEGFELGITRAILMVPAPTAATTTTTTTTGQTENASEVEYLRPAQDAGAWGSETTGDLLY